MMSVGTEKAGNNNYESKIITNLIKSLKSLKSGNILVEIENKPTVDIKATLENDTNRIDVDLLDPDILGIFKQLVVEKHEDSINERTKRSPSSFDKIKDKLDIAKDFFHMFTDSEKNLFEQFSIVKKFAEKLSDNNVTVVLLRKGKEAIVIGKDANPTLSRLLSRSDDVQIKSVTESSKLVGDISVDDNHSNREIV
jgi:hypothetical protein